MVYGRHHFKKNGDGIICCFKMDITCGVCSGKAGILDDKTVPAAFLAGCKRRISGSRHYVRQTVRMADAEDRYPRHGQARRRAVFLCRVVHLA